ncbi:MAG: DUF480 domain-containing protein [Gammaproteobacteria bacterium]|jgi:uncharacterized protein YceH (UPF0502 family)
MRIQLTDLEARVIGVLIEKAVTTPDQYPLSLNALRNGCNQKSNRDPVLKLEEAEVQSVLDGLGKKHLVMEKSGFGSRVPKYQHRFCNSEFGSLKFSDQELGLVCVLLLRGPQTAGELRSRTHRHCSFNDAGEVEATLRGLMQREDGPFVTQLAREPGKRESRFAHLFCGPVSSGTVSADPEPAVRATPVPNAPDPSHEARLRELEEVVAILQKAVADLQRQIRPQALHSGPPTEDDVDQ